MKRLFALNVATHVENGEKNLIARKSLQLVFLVKAKSKLCIDVKPITVGEQRRRSGEKAAFHQRGSA